MVFAPDHFRGAAERRPRRRVERLSLRFAAVLTAVLVGLVVFSLTTHQKRSGNGCIDFSYTTMIGGAEMYKCGQDARTLCATRPGRASIDADFQTQLYAACRKAHLVLPAS